MCFVCLLFIGFVKALRKCVIRTHHPSVQVSADAKTHATSTKIHTYIHTRKRDTFALGHSKPHLTRLPNGSRFKLLV
jgi:hypothetical protein